MNNKNGNNKITIGVSGMHCASCAKIIENKLNKEDSIKEISVNPLTEQAEISYNPETFNQEDISKKVKDLGYSLNISKENNDLDEIKDQKEKELKDQRIKLSFAIPVTVIILFFVFWNIFSSQPLPSDNIFTPFAFIAASITLFWIGFRFIKAAIRFFRTGQANMDTLIGVGTGTAYFYSAIILFFPQLRETLNLKEMYFFDVTVVVVTLVFLGKYLENKAKAKTSEVIEKLINLQTKTAIVEKDGKEKEVLINELKLNDVVIVKPGMKVPADGAIVFGQSALDESLLTGESIPVDKKKGDEVIGSTINSYGLIKVKINKVGKDTVLSNIIKAIERAQNSKAPIQKLADQVAGVFVPIVLALAVITLATWLILGSMYLGWPLAVSLGITCFVSILAIACPCALGLATPTGIMVGLGLASKNGLLIKNASSLEKFGKTKVIVLDKTGTITTGQPDVDDIVSIQISKEEILRISASLEKGSEHPLAQAIVKMAKEKNTKINQVMSFKDFPGRGVSGKINGNKYWLGNASLINELKAPLPEEQLKKLAAQGKTPVILSDEKNVLGIITISDQIKESAKEAIAQLHKMGIKTIMLSGDHKKTAEHIAKEAGIYKVIAEVSPTEKAEVVRKIKGQGKITAMVGDGVNDAVALVEADVGIAMANGSDIAIESADITVLHGELDKIVKALKISKLTMKKIKQNLFWAFFYNIIAIPVAAGVFYPNFGLLLSPIIAAGAMSFSSLSIVFNTLLMKRAKI